ncbi:MAG: hypothetical protein K8H88_10580 [Sandaracinaceae bacterium]|nr:hypothetical protein [Sandaracinaceae bacterium]
MHSSEASREARCAACGVHITTSGDRVFAFGEDRVLCFACSIARGGIHDEEAGRWTQPPDHEDLLAVERDP